MWGWQQRLDAGAQEGEWIGAVREGVKKTVTNVISQKMIFAFLQISPFTTRMPNSAT